MPDALKKRDAQDRARINIDEDHQVRYWTKLLGVDVKTLKEVVKTVGTSSAAVRQHLKNGKHLH